MCQRKCDVAPKPVRLRNYNPNQTTLFQLYCQGSVKARMPHRSTHINCHSPITKQRVHCVCNLQVIVFVFPRCRGCSVREWAQMTQLFRVNEWCRYAWPWLRKEIQIPITEWSAQQKLLNYRVGVVKVTQFKGKLNVGLLIEPNEIFYRLVTGGRQCAVINFFPKQRLSHDSLTLLMSSRKEDWWREGFCFRGEKFVGGTCRPLACSCTTGSSRSRSLRNWNIPRNA